MIGKLVRNPESPLRRFPKHGRREPRQRPGSPARQNQGHHCRGGAHARGHPAGQSGRRLARDFRERHGTRDGSDHGQCHSGPLSELDNGLTGCTHNRRVVALWPGRRDWGLRTLSLVVLGGIGGESRLTHGGLPLYQVPTPGLNVLRSYFTIMADLVAIGHLGPLTLIRNRSPAPALSLPPVRTS
jgi:hypothetical protein